MEKRRRELSLDELDAMIDRFQAACVARKGRPKASPERIAEIIRSIQEAARPEEWPTFGMTEGEVIEHCRKTRQRLWEEKMARRATRS